MAVVELERTFALVKPDAVAADNADEILHIAELKGFKVLARQRLRVRLSSGPPPPPQPAAAAPDADKR